MMYGYGIGISPNNRLFSGNSVLDPDASAFITTASITDGTQQSAINQLVLDLKSYSIWSKIYAIYPMVGGNSTAHSYNLIDTSLFQLSFVGGWTHSSTGALPNGTNALANTGWIQNNFPEANFNSTIGFYSGTSTDGNADLGAYGGSGKTYLLRSRNSNLFGSYNQGQSTYSTVANTDGSGFYSSSRLDSSTISLYKNGVLVSNPSNVSTAGMVLVQMQLSAYNSGFFGSKEHRLSFISLGLNDTENANLYTAVQAFQTTLSRNL